MKTFRLYYDKDAETAYLQAMADRGWALQHYALGVYTFEPCEPGEYRYEIDLLKTAGEYADYRQFMEESGVTVICRWVRWVYLRKKTAEGPFRLYSDAASLIQHYTSIRRFFLPFAILEFICALLELLAGRHEPLFLGFGILFAVIGVVFLRVVWKCGWKIEELKKLTE